MGRQLVRLALIKGTEQTIQRTPGQFHHRVREFDDVFATTAHLKVDITKKAVGLIQELEGFYGPASVQSLATGSITTLWETLGEKVNENSSSSGLLYFV